MKYIITSKGPIIFPESFTHSDFKHINAELESAGNFTSCVLPTGEVHVFIGPSGSLSLNLPAKVEEDKADLQRLIACLVND